MSGVAENLLFAFSFVVFLVAHRSIPSALARIIECLQESIRGQIHLLPEAPCE